MIYLDNAATTQVIPEVREAMLSFLRSEFGNPSSIHGPGRAARRVVEHAREQVAELVGCTPDDIVFTSGGTEANAAAITGAWLAGLRASRNQIVTTAVEHHSVLETCAFLARLGADVTYLQPAADGSVSVADVVQSVSGHTAVVSVMAVNNELGTVYPVGEIARAVHDIDAQVMVHSDIVQAVCAADVSSCAMQVDLATVSAHKLHGPQGVGALCIRPGTRFEPVLRGGRQERGRRAGTENVPGIIGFGVAAQWLRARADEHLRHLDGLRRTFLDHVLDIPGTTLYSPADAAPSIVNVGFAGVPADRLLMLLDLAGVAASSGSACTAGSLEPSHVLSACGYPEEAVRQAVRFSFSALTTLDDVVNGAAVIGQKVKFLRQSSLTS